MPRCDGTGPYRVGCAGRMRGRFGCCCSRRCMRRGYFEQACSLVPCLRKTITPEEKIAMLEKYKQKIEKEIVLLKKELQDG